MEDGALTGVGSEERVVAESQLQLARDAFTDLTGLPVEPGDVALPRDLPPAEAGDASAAIARAVQANPALRMAEALRLCSS